MTEPSSSGLSLSLKRKREPADTGLSLAVERKREPADAGLALAVERKREPADTEFALAVEQKREPADAELSLAVEQKREPADAELSLAVEQKREPADAEFALAVEQKSEPADTGLALAVEQKSEPADTEFALAVEQKREPADAGLSLALEQKREPADAGLALAVEQKREPADAEFALAVEQKREPADARLSLAVGRIFPAKTLEFSEKAKELSGRGVDVCDLTVGEPDVDTPSFIKEACVAALKNGKTKYAPLRGLLALREKLAEKYSTATQQLGPENVLVVSGVKYAVYLSLLATCNTKDKLLLPSPYWTSYPQMARMLDLDPVLIPTEIESGFKLTVPLLKNYLKKGAKALLLNSPANPTGATYTQEELSEIVHLALEDGLLIISDEIYSELIYQQDSPAPSPANLGAKAFARTVRLDGFSKSFSMTGWRLGMALAPRVFIDAMAKIQSHTTSSPCTFAQYGALAALEQPERSKAFLKKVLKSYRERRGYLTEQLQGLKKAKFTPPQGSFYAWLDIRNSHLDSDTCARELLEKHHVATIPGTAFGLEGFLRLSFATSSATLEKATVALRDYFM